YRNESNLPSRHDAQEIGVAPRECRNLRRRVTVQRDAFSGRQALLANGKGVATVFAFNLPAYVRADYVETFALSGANFYVHLPPPGCFVTQCSWNVSLVTSGLDRGTTLF